MTKINTFSQLVSFIEKTPLSPEQLKQILSQSVKVYIPDYTDKNQVVKELKEYWKQYGHLQERPLFINKPNEQIKITDFENILFKFKP